MTSVHHSSKRHDWRTPRNLIDRIHCVFNGIWLDPCAPQGDSNPTRSGVVYRENGLELPWYRGSLVRMHKLVFCNPPHGRELPRWVDKSVSEYMSNMVEVLLLTPARTDTRWFKRLVDAHKTQFCFVRGRLTFEPADAPAPFPSLISYMGPRKAEFRDGFKDLGWIP